MSRSRRYFCVFVVTFTCVIYFLPYLAYDFYNQFIEAYGVTDSQIGYVISAFGFTAVPGYFIGGWLADRFNAKWMVVASCFSTAVVGFLVSICHSFNLLLVLYLCFGVTTTCLHWCAYLKVVRSLGSDDEQGRLYGIAQVAYGICGLFMAYGVLTLMQTLLSGVGFRGAINVYAGIVLVFGVLTMIFVPYDMDKAALGEDEKIKFSLLGKVMKMKITWYLGMFTMGFFIIRSCIPYINPMLTSAYGVSVPFATAFTLTVRNAGGLISAPIGGAIKDRMGRSTPLVVASSAATIVLAVIFALIPQVNSAVIWVMVVAIILIFFSYFPYNCLYTPVSEAQIPLKYTGTVLGVVSSVGYSVDMWLYTVGGTWIDKFGNLGYTYIFWLQVGGAVMMLVFGILLWTCFPKRAKAGQPVPGLSQ